MTVEDKIDFDEIEKNKEIFLSAWFHIAGRYGRTARTTHLSRYIRKVLGYRHVKDLKLGDSFKYVTIHFEFFEWQEKPPSIKLRKKYKRIEGNQIVEDENFVYKITKRR